MRHRSKRPPLDIRHLRPFLAELVSRVAAAGVRSFRVVVAGAAALLLGGASMVTSSLASDVGSHIATEQPHEHSPTGPVGGGGEQSPVPSPTQRESASRTSPAPTTRTSPSRNPSSSRPTATRPTTTRPSVSATSLVPSSPPASRQPSAATSVAPSVTASAPVLVDTTAPQTTATTSWATRDSWVLALSADEPATFECSLDGGPYQPCTRTQAFFSLTGRHTLAVRATDQAGNTDPTPAELTWTPATDMSNQQ